MAIDGELIPKPLLYRSSILRSPIIKSKYLQANMSTFGTLFRVTTYGESHCASVGCIVDGVPPVSQVVGRRNLEKIKLN